MRDEFVLKLKHYLEANFTEVTFEQNDKTNLHRNYSGNYDIFEC